MSDEENARWRPDPDVADRWGEKRPDRRDVDGANGRVLVEGGKYTGIPAGGRFLKRSPQ